MRFNVASRGFAHPRYLYFHKKWDREPKFNPGWFRQWRRTFFWKGKVKVQEIPVPIAKGYSTVDANQFVEEESQPWNDPYTWPYEKKYENGTPDDPNYKPVMSNHFNRSTTLLEGFKGAMNFTNSVMEGEDSLPNELVTLEQGIQIDDQFMQLLEKRLRFAYDEDSVCARLPKLRTWPKLNLKPRHVIGTPVSRTELNILSSFYDICQLWINKHHGIIDRRRLNNPEVWLPFVRDKQLITMQLTCDFLSLAQRFNNNYLKPVLARSTQTVYDEPAKTIDKNLISINPCNWEICFNKTHWYNPDPVYKIPLTDQIHTIYLTDSKIRFKKLVDRFAKGRALMFCYGYGVAQYRLRHGNWNNHEDKINYQVLQSPIILNSVFSNLSKKSIGFCSFQLNTTSFDSEVKNQVWFNGPFNIEENKELILKKMIALNLFGPYNTPSLIVNNVESKENQEVNSAVN